MYEQRLLALLSPQAIKVLLRKSIEHFRCMYYISKAISSLLTGFTATTSHLHRAGVSILIHFVFILLFSAVGNSYSDKVKHKHLCRKSSFIFQLMPVKKTPIN